VRRRRRRPDASPALPCPAPPQATVCSLTGPASQCPAGTTCQKTSGCATARCDAASATIITTACAATCRPALTPQPISAAFADYSDLIIVDLNTNALLDEAAGCEGMLRPASAQLLGSFPRCEAQGSKLYLYPSSDASIMPGSTIFLNKGQTALRDAVTGAALTGKATISNCTTCNPPKAVISGPSVVYNPCAANAAAAPYTAAAVFDGTQSFGSAGRPLASARWSLRGSATDAVLRQALTDANAKADARWGGPPAARCCPALRAWRCCVPSAGSCARLQGPEPTRGC
jgi:hypothetical protein